MRLTFAMAAALLPAASAHAMRHAFMVQNSGWMEPFYTDPTSQFKQLTSAVIRQAAAPGDDVFLLAFNQSSGDNKSPVLLAEGKGAGNPDAVLGALRVAVKNTRSGALADTDFKEAVTSVFSEQLKSQPGIVWLFTNNKNSPGNDPQTALRNKEFYELLHLEPAISRTLAFPLRMQVKSKYEASGMMVYALAFGDEAGAHLARMVESGQLSKIFTNPPARLKPTDQDAVRLIPKGVVNNTANVAVSLARDGRTLLLDVEASEILPKVEITAGFQNLFYPYVIATAKPTAAMKGSWGSEAVKTSPASVTDVQPGEARELTISLPMPLAQVPSPWSAAAISAMGKRVLIPATLEISLADQRLALSEGFSSSLRQLFPGDPISDVFLPPDSVRASSASVPMLIRIQYPLFPVVVAVVLALALLSGLAALFVIAGRTPRYPVAVDGVKRSVAMKAFRSVDVRNANGVVVGKLKRGFGRPVVVDLVEGHDVVVK